MIKKSKCKKFLNFSLSLCHHTNESVILMKIRIKIDPDFRQDDDKVTILTFVRMTLRLEIILIALISNLAV